jgi:hypothetical protein
MKKPKPLAGNNPGYNAKPTKLQGKAPSKPHYQGASDWARDLGHSAEKAAGHAAHDIAHGVGKAKKKIGNVIDDLNPF